MLNEYLETGQFNDTKDEFWDNEIY
jgi:hypothetical protein